MKIAKLMVCGLATTCLVGMKNVNAITEEPATNVELKDTELVRLSEGLNLNKVNDSSKMGENPNKIFDHLNPNFKKAFITTDNTEGFSNSFVSSTKSDFAKKYHNGFGIKGGYHENASVPEVGSANFNFDAKFNMEVGSELQNVKENYYEVYETYKQNKVSTVNWETIKNIDELLTDNFKNSYSSIKLITDASDFIDKFGSHLFQTYYFGGKLTMSSHVVSEKNIKEEYKKAGAELSLSRGISMAMNGIEGANGAEIAGHVSHIESQKVINDYTKSDMKVTHEGGRYLNGITIDNLFTYNQEYVNERGSGYVYRAWLNSIDRGEALRICRVANPVFVWDAIKNSSLFNAEPNALLDKAYLAQLYSKYYDNCLYLNRDPEYLAKINYSSANGDFSFNVTGNEISLPSGSKSDFELGKTIKDNLKNTSLKFALDKEYSYATLTNENGKQILKINDKSDGKNLVLNLQYENKTIYSLNINIKSGAFEVGYGTKDQPYLIRNLGDWNQLVKNNSYLNKELYFRLENDIDLKGYHFESLGSSKKTTFNGYFDGNNHSVSNATVISKGNWNNIGLFGVNNGIIKNLKLNNIIVLNDQVLSGDLNGEINAGVLAGLNTGVIKNVSLNKCAIRITSQVSDNSLTNVGGLVGKNEKEINYSTVDNVKVMNQSSNEASKGLFATGGFVGKNFGGTIKDCLLRNSNIKTRNICNATSDLYLGGFAGKCENNGEVISKISFIIAYDNDFGSTNEKTGVVSGIANNNSLFENCYFSYGLDAAIGGKHKDGCYRIKNMTLDEINNNEFNNNWKSDANGKPVLKDNLF